MKITTFEQISLINQFKILEKLYPEDLRIYKPLRVILEHGFDCGINNIQEWLQSDKSQETYELVLEILKMVPVQKLLTRNIECQFPLSC
ncbi:YfbU family protein [Priestia megaterium]|jgi:uncharacterized protein YfbU (UPF0304 family)|uniref:YfbU family protein n=1 Tax=Priestia megaterium TaxID=1404 RepID=UPI0028657B8F|nr:YfbU family protein [Priestia megaterium]MDR7246974.1 uncharacterized protein YfbU (UPF0304 family) [Priestia megaterium]